MTRRGVARKLRRGQPWSAPAIVRWCVHLATVFVAISYSLFLIPSSMPGIPSIRGEDPCHRTVLFQASYVSDIVTGSYCMDGWINISLRGVMLRGKILGKGRFDYQVGWCWSAECYYWLLPRIGQSYKVVRVVLFCDCIS